MNSSKTRKIKIPADIMAELNALPDSNGSGTKTAFTPEQDAVLLAIWPTKTHEACVSWWREKYGRGCRDTLTRRYKELTKGQAK